MEELMEKVEETRREHVEYTVEEMLPDLFTFLYMEGFDLAGEEHTKTTAFFIESFKSALLATVGLEHPLQKTAEDSCFIVDYSIEPMEEEPELPPAA